MRADRSILASQINRLYQSFFWYFLCVYWPFVRCCVCECALLICESVFSILLQPREEWKPYKPVWSQNMESELPYNFKPIDWPMQCHDHSTDMTKMLVGKLLTVFQFLILAQCWQVDKIISRIWEVKPPERLWNACYGKISYQAWKILAYLCLS